MKKILYVLMILTLSISAVQATESRIESMGGNQRFMLDEMAMFTNPAYAIIYPNILTGSLGYYPEVQYFGGGNISEQWFGGWASVPVGGRNIVVGAALNRHDSWEEYLIAKDSLIHQIDFADLDEYKGQALIILNANYQRDTISRLDTGLAENRLPGNILQIYDSISYDTVYGKVPKPVGETEIFIGHTLGNLGLGARAYIAQQDSSSGGYQEAASGIIRGDLGLVMKMGNKDLFDLSFSIARMNNFYSFDITDVSEATFSYAMNARAFITVPSFSGQIVPALNFSQITIAADTGLFISPGIGFCREIKGGNFWTGVEYKYSKTRDMSVNVHDATKTHSTILGFGIEKQVAWPWFTLRVGGKKVINKTEYEPGGNEKPSVFKSTNEDADVIGAGFSFRVQEKLRFDVSANERIPFSNILGGEPQTLARRITATYSF